VSALEPKWEKRSDAELADSTPRLRDRLAKGETVDDVLPEAFAAVREAGKRTLKQRMFDVQLMGGLVLHKGHIAEMRTGEGKTHVASLALYLNALEGKGAHLITTNDYLAKTGAGWMATIYHALGLSEDSSQTYYTFARVAEQLHPDSDYVVEEKYHAVNLTEDGIARAEKLLQVKNLYEGDVTAVHYLDNAVKAKALYRKDKEYVVKDG